MTVYYDKLSKDDHLGYNNSNTAVNNKEDTTMADMKDMKLNDEALDRVVGGAGDSSSTTLNKYEPATYVMYKGKKCMVMGCVIDTFGNEKWLYRLQAEGSANIFENVPERELSPA